MTTEIIEKKTFSLKVLSKEGIETAHEKAIRYRLLNEPKLAESICLDILEVDPKNHEAIITLLLAITDQFGQEVSVFADHARELLQSIEDRYERMYYEGLICERQGKAILQLGMPGSIHIAYEWLHEAMDHYERAESIRPHGNDDAILRWNTCARLIMRNKLTPRQEGYVEPYHD